MGNCFGGQKEDNANKGKRGSLPPYQVVGQNLPGDHTKQLALLQSLIERCLSECDDIRKTIVEIDRRTERIEKKQIKMMHLGGMGADQKVDEIEHIMSQTQSKNEMRNQQILDVVLEMSRNVDAMRRGGAGVPISPQGIARGNSGPNINMEPDPPTRSLGPSSPVNRMGAPMYAGQQQVHAPGYNPYGGNYYVEEATARSPPGQHSPQIPRRGHY